MSAFSMQPKKDALQPNEQEIDLEGLWQKIRVWVYAVLTLLIIAAGCVWAYFFFKQQANETELAAESLLAGASDEQALRLVIDKYPQTDAATHALMLLAYQSYRRADWKGAQESYQRVFDKAGSAQPDIGAAALFGMGIAFEGEKSWDKALESYSSLTTTYPNSYKTVEAKLAAARVHEEKGELEKARQLYENIVVSHPQSEWTATAEQRLRLLSARLKK